MRVPAPLHPPSRAPVPTRGTYPRFRSVAAMAVATFAFTVVASAETAVAPAQLIEPDGPKAPESSSLKETFKPVFLVGAARNVRQFAGTDARSTEFITREFNCATAENEMKWEVVEPNNNQFDFA